MAFLEDLGGRLGWMRTEEGDEDFANLVKEVEERQDLKALVK